MKASKPLVNILKLLFTILLLFLVFKSVDLSRIRQDLRSFHLASLVLLLAACWASQLLCSERWRLFAASMQMPGRYLNFVQMYFVGMFFNIGLPSLVGGDVVKAYIVSRRNNKPLQVGLASVLQDRAVGLITLLIYGSIAILIHPISWRGIPLWLAYLFSWLAIAVFLILAAKGEILYRHYIHESPSTVGAKILKSLAEFHQALSLRGIGRGEALRITLYSFINSALVLCIFQQVIFAAGQQVEIVPFSALYPLVTLATMLPITLSGIGVREWFYVEALSLVGIPRELGLMISLATSALGLLCNLGGIIFLPGIPRELRPQSPGASHSK